MPARSRQFRRVSTTKQDADKQIADLDAWDASHEYVPGPAYVADGESAYHLKHLARLEKALEDIRADAFDVLTFWKTDRMWRGKSAARAVYLIEQIEEAGGTVEFVTEPHLNFNPAIPKIARDQMLMGAFGASHAESKAKSDRTRMDIASKRATGSAHGRAPWGYAVQCQICGKITQRLEDGSVDRCGHKDNKRFVPTDVGRRWTPVIYDLVISGHSLRNVAEYLTVNEVPTTSGKIWHEAFLAQLVANPAYKGTRRGGGPNMELQPLVGPTIWDQAQLAVASRARLGRGTTTQPKALVRPVCGRCFGVEREGCTDGISPMYRQPRGPRGQRVGIYRCFGHGPQRIGCGAEIPVAQLDAAVVAMISGDTRMHTESVFVPGDDHADQISRLREKGAEAMRQGDYERATRCMHEAAELEKQPSTRPHWDEVELDITRGQHFQSMDSAAQRDYLKKWRPVARIEDGRLLIDLDAFTDEHGVKIGLRTDGNTAPAFSINGTSEQVRIAVAAGDKS